MGRTWGWICLVKWERNIENRGIWRLDKDSLDGVQNYKWKVRSLRWTWSRHSVTTSGSHDNFFLDFHRWSTVATGLGWSSTGWPYPCSVTVGGFQFCRGLGNVRRYCPLTHVLCSAGAKFSSPEARGTGGEAAPGTIGHVWALGSAPPMIELREVRKCIWRHHTNSLCSNSLSALLLWVASHPPGRARAISRMKAFCCCRGSNDCSELMRTLSEAVISV